MKRQWQDCCGGNVFLGSGAFEFSDFVVFGRFGLMLDPVNDVALVGGSLHMNVPLACYCVSICPPEFAGVVNEDQTGFEIDWPQDMPDRIESGDLDDEPRSGRVRSLVARFRAAPDAGRVDAFAGDFSLSL